MKSKKYLIPVIAVIIVLIGAGFYLKNQKSSKTPAINTNSEITATTTPVSQTEPSGKIAGFTLSDVAKHATPSNCWTAIRTDVFSLTAWIATHPGGEEAIIKICGKNGTSLFVNKHGGMAQQEAKLLEFKIGVLSPTQ